jgi:hypothetical protein
MASSSCLAIQFESALVEPILVLQELTRFLEMSLDMHTLHSIASTILSNDNTGVPKRNVSTLRRGRIGEHRALFPSDIATAIKNDIDETTHVRNYVALVDDMCSSTTDRGSRCSPIVNRPSHMQADHGHTR